MLHFTDITVTGQILVFAVCIDSQVMMKAGSDESKILEWFDKS